MKPINFISTNKILTGENVDPLPVYHGQGMYLSRWKATFVERLSILFYGTIWVAIASDHCPPLSISGNQSGYFIHPDVNG